MPPERISALGDKIFNLNDSWIHSELIQTRLHLCCNMEPSSPIFDAEPEFLDLDALDPDIYEGFDLYSSSPSEGDDGSVEDQVEVCG